ncbi:Uu.00g079700.m01.CDS01 [Anthostomella pinea]|uniref:Uu.00g079700.m01.CDS01 n=1 Tax=Anthostomella pinea TaxID=933095 RepID=A0AAI8VKV4_9PEZI|nr:Uu.00g079700.m01.CDS01 [Anthostomella pinea]
MVQSQVWLITGASRGLGLEITKAALKAGHTLDVAGTDVESQIRSAVTKHGKIDVLVNNAAYAVLGSIENTRQVRSIGFVDAIFKTNVLGCLRTIQAVLPSMRQRKAGTIVHISSSEFVGPTPALGVYSATKFAMEEVASFNIRTLVMVPGGIRTGFSDPSGTGVEVPLDDAYKGTAVEWVTQAAKSPQFNADFSDPVEVAQRIVDAVDGTGIMKGRELGRRVPLGKDTAQHVEKRAQEYADMAKNLKDIAESV